MQIESEMQYFYLEVFSGVLTNNLQSTFDLVCIRRQNKYDCRYHFIAISEPN